jgi:ribose transport system ATP-binding protein
LRKEVFRIDNVTFSRGGVNLLDRFNLHVFEGEILGLFFSDNNGKDEFVRLAMDNHPVDYGRVFFMDSQVNSYSGDRSVSSPNGGIGYVSKDDWLISDMSVAENVFLMRRGFRKYVIDKTVLLQQFSALAEEYGIDIDGGLYARDLSRSERYIIQALKFIVAGSALVIVRNVSLEYGHAELFEFQNQMRRFAGRGISFIYISGDMNVLKNVCDRIAVSEGGRIVTSVAKDGFRTKKLDRYQFYPDRLPTSQSVDTVSLLKFDNVRGGEIRGLDFFVANGESVLLWDRNDRILGDVFSLLSRETRPESGEIRFDGSPLSAPGKGGRISFIKESPTRSMIFGEMSYMDNLCLRAAERSPSLWLGPALRRIIRNEYRGVIGAEIDASSPLGLTAEALYLLVYMREYIYNPMLLVIERPFLETDVRLRLRILSLISMFRDRGTSILVLDSSTTDSDAIVDRTLVVTGGRVTGEKTRRAEEEAV